MNPVKQAHVEAIEINDYTRLLVYKRGYTADFVQRTLASEGLAGLQVRDEFPDERFSDLEFLKEFSFLTQLQITATRSPDYEYTFLSELKALESLVFTVSLLSDAKAKPLDLAQAPQLKSLILTWREGISGLEQLTQLESLRLWEYRTEDLRGISALTQLKNFVVSTSSIRSVSGIETLRALETLVLGACKRLRDLDGLAALQQLRELRIAGCPKVTELRALAQLSKLRDLTLEDCRSLESVEPLAGLQLDSVFLAGTTNIRDGNTKPLRQVRDLSYSHRKHYNELIPTPIADARAKENQRKILELWNASMKPDA